MKIYKETLDSCTNTEGVVVVVDVLRAFTTTAFAFARGALEIFLVSTVEQAFELRDQQPDLLLVGEVNGYPIEGFDLPNSPSVIKDRELTGQRLVLRTTAGTQGVIRASHAPHLYVASLCVVTATAEILRMLRPEAITFVNTGVSLKGGGEEDVACANYIESLICEAPLSISAVKGQVRRSRAAVKFSDPQNADFPVLDLQLALEIDSFPFAMEVSKEEGYFILRKTNLSVA